MTDYIICTVGDVNLSFFVRYELASLNNKSLTHSSAVFIPWARLGRQTKGRQQRGEGKLLERARMEPNGEEQPSPSTITRGH